jgi:hypothetical protein
MLFSLTITSLLGGKCELMMPFKVSFIKMARHRSLPLCENETCCFSATGCNVQHQELDYASIVMQ